ncbi:DnaD domain-containing protein [Bacillus sp. JJ1562]|uniref:DnaD domain-containing protein n=1 Tax=Bacillus sp. JJ1562 TaxID=3122960 RepID=UPI0030023B49
MNGNLLIEESPLLIIPSLATLIGLNESIILQQIHYWLKRTNNFRLDRKWVYFTYDHLAKQIPFLSKSTIRRAISNLENDGLLSSDHFNKLKMDKTKWYTINYENLENLKVNEIECVDLDLTPTETKLPPSIQNEQTMCSNQADDLLNMDSPCVQNEQSSCSNWAEDVFNLNRPIPESTSEITTKNTTETTSSSSKPSGKKEDKENPFNFFEQNGFGSISSYISEKIQAWSNDLSDELIIEAMKLAIENASKRWSYVEAILRDWVDKGYQTLDDVQAARLAYKQQKKHPFTKKPIRQECIPDWFHEREQNHEATHDPTFEDKKRLFEERMKKYTERDCDKGMLGQ